MVQYTEWRSISDGSIISSIPDSVIYHWPVDESSGSTITDSEQNKDMDLNSPSWGDDYGYGGHYLHFDGVDDLATASNESDFEGQNEITVNFWFRSDSDPDSDLSDWSNAFGITNDGGSTSAGNLSWLFYIDDGRDEKLLWRISDGGSRSSSIGPDWDDVFDGQWHMITGTFEAGGDVKAYLDGDLVESGDATSSMDSVGETLNIGGNEDQDRMVEGDYDRPLIADDGWSESKVSDWYDQTKSDYE